MFRPSLLLVCFCAVLWLATAHGKNVTGRRRPLAPVRKPASIKLCGPALVRMLDMVCDRARQLLLKSQSATGHSKRQMLVDDDPFTRTLSFKDYARK